MTSNVGTSMVEKNTIGFSALGKDREGDDRRKRLLDALRHQFRPEFLNRIDDIIVFNTLSRENLSQIVDIQLAGVSKMLKDRKLKLTVTPAAKDAIIAEGYDPQFGARPMRRAIQRLVQDPLAQKLLRGEFQEGETIEVDVRPGATELQFSAAAVTVPRS
jgi:ATP-dependent Clp protease ATP-binding subunit ClpA